MKSTRFSRSSHSSSLSTGGAKKPFAAFRADSDSEDEVVATVPAPISLVSLDDPIYAAMDRGDMLWGDLLIPAVAMPSYAPIVVPVERPFFAEEDLWAQPWSDALEAHWNDCYDMTALTDDAWSAMMTWLYSVGWAIVSESRKCVIAYPDNQPARVWVPPSRFELAAQMDDHHHSHSHCSHSKPPTVPAQPKKKVPVPRFCRAAGACTEEGCRYIHGDTIPRINEPCSFGADCGASDPTGLKRSQCLRMHPGETWTDGMVIHRPPTN
jgi:hypothetical protein